MAEPHDPSASAEALAQSRTGGAVPPDGAQEAGRQPGEGRDYAIDPRIDLAPATQLYERTAGEPLYRRLPVFAFDASTPRRSGRTTLVKLPYEPLSRGVRGSVLEVDCATPEGPPLRRADLDDPHVLLEGGYAPSITDPRFHQQMVYAVAMQTYAQFQTALGRQLSWGFDRRGASKDGRNRLTLRPFGAPRTAQAWYDRTRGEVVFGFFEPSRATPSVPNRAGSNVFLSLCHDVIVHEVTHAILDGLRPAFFVASHPDVAAFHEGFADLVAVFQRFAVEEAVMAALAETRGDLSRAGDLARIGAEFARAVHPDLKALRTLCDLDREETRAPYDCAPEEPHERGGYLARAVFHAFMTIYGRRSTRLIRLATGGTGVLPPGDLNHELKIALVAEVRRIALQFLALCIRAIDYCPPVDIRFGDYLRALVTADYDLVPDDDWGYREALIEGFGREGIFGEGTPFMSEEALLWSPPLARIAPITPLSFGAMQFDGDPARPAGLEELRRQAGAIGQRLGDPDFARECGLVPPAAPGFTGGGYGLPVIQSVRSARRVGPDSQVTFDTVAEIVQTRRVGAGGTTMLFQGGTTLIVSPRGGVRFVIRKRVDQPRRLAQQLDYAAGAGALYWRRDDGVSVPREDIFSGLCR